MLNSCLKNELYTKLVDPKCVSKYSAEKNDNTMTEYISESKFTLGFYSILSYVFLFKILF